MVQDFLADLVDLGAELLVLVKDPVLQLEVLVALALALLQLEELFLVALQVGLFLGLEGEELLDAAEVVVQVVHALDAFGFGLLFFGEDHGFVGFGDGH